VDRRRFLLTSLVGALAAPLGAPAQPAGSRRIGYLESSSPSPARLQLLEAFRQGLRELGYLEGKDIVFESRFGEGKPDQIRRFAAELVELKVDILVTSGTPATGAAKQATRTIPIVMTQLADPVGSGLVASLGRPGGNVTGLSTQDADLGGKRLELLLQVVPRVSRLAQLVDETSTGTVLIGKGTKARERHEGGGGLGGRAASMSGRARKGRAGRGIRRHEKGARRCAHSGVEPDVVRVALAVALPRRPDKGDGGIRSI
jgi:hypothetical protein